MIATSSSATLRQRFLSVIRLGPTKAVRKLNLRVGQWVEVRSAEILATVDENGCLDGLPFMPEMLNFCGRRYRVLKRATKVIDMVRMTGCGE